MHRLLTRILTTMVLLATVLCAPTQTKAQGAAADMSAVKAIDNDCLAIQNAIMALHPSTSRSCRASGTCSPTQTSPSHNKRRPALPSRNIWKTDTGYAWVHAHSFDAQGNQRATQLCFRQKDGTLERARQASTVPDLDSASAKAAYYNSDGTVVFSVAAFDTNDPMVTKTIQSLPFYSQLPQ